MIQGSKTREPSGTRAVFEVAPGMWRPFVAYCGEWAIDGEPGTDLAAIVAATRERAALHGQGRVIEPPRAGSPSDATAALMKLIQEYAGLRVAALSLHHQDSPRAHERARFFADQLIQATIPAELARLLASAAQPEPKPEGGMCSLCDELAGDLMPVETWECGACRGVRERVGDPSH